MLLARYPSARTHARSLPRTHVRTARGRLAHDLLADFFRGCVDSEPDPQASQFQEVGEEGYGGRGQRDGFDVEEIDGILQAQQQRQHEQQRQEQQDRL